MLKNMKIFACHLVHIQHMFMQITESLNLGHLKHIFLDLKSWVKRLKLYDLQSQMFLFGETPYLTIFFVEININDFISNNSAKKLSIYLLDTWIRVEPSTFAIALILPKFTRRILITLSLKIDSARRSIHQPSMH